MTDISYFKVKEGWLYLSAIKDLFNNEIVAFLCSHRCDAELATATLRQLRGRKHYVNALMHSDLGSTYVSHVFLEECNFQGFVKSFSRKGECWDNACMESFFGTVKSETGYYDSLKSGLLTYKEMERTLTDYMNRYNNKRIQQKLGWLSPVAFRTCAA